MLRDAGAVSPSLHRSFLRLPTRREQDDEALHKERGGPFDGARLTPRPGLGPGLGRLRELWVPHGGRGVDAQSRFFPSMAIGFRFIVS